MSTVNKILKEKKKEENDSSHLYDLLSTRNSIPALEILNIMITLAKVNIITQSFAAVTVTQLLRIK